MGDGMDRFGVEAVRDACIVQWQAEALAGVDLPRNSISLVPPRWTAWLLMEKAGVPRHLIAYVCHADRRHVRNRIRRARLLMLYPPYAALVERLSEQVCRFGAPHIPTTRRARGATCALAG